MKRRSLVEYWATEATWAVLLCSAAHTPQGRRSLWYHVVLARCEFLEKRIEELTIQHAEKEFRQD